jgi:uncharacterized protein (UPF0548 family)
MSWQVHVRAGLAVCAAGPTAKPGMPILVGLRLGPMRLAAPCRVVYVVDEAARRGFAYGTLAGHPESGEEAFVVGQEGDGTVWLTINAFSRPATMLARVAGPLGRAIQQQITSRYLRAAQG